MSCVSFAQLAKVLLCRVGRVRIAQSYSFLLFQSAEPRLLLLLFLRERPEAGFQRFQSLSLKNTLKELN